MSAAGLDERLELERRLCRASLIDFIRAVAPWFVIEEIHLLIAEELEALERGDCDRLMIFMPPRSGKSETISKLFPAWYLGRRPNEKVMQVSYKAELATDFGRQVRELIKSPAYQHVFPGVELRADVKAAGHWMITHKLEGQQQGEYYASGITGGIAGRGWNLGIIDDPLSEQDAVSDVARAFVRNWYGPGFYTRRQPERNVAVIMTCMTGDTPVLMADGTERPLREVTPGDTVMTWDNGAMIPQKVTNWRVAGEDDVLEIRTGGSKVRANGRHPFLVQRGDGVHWVQASDLRKGDALVCSGRPDAFANRPYTAEIAWLIGVMLGDGWTVMRSRRKATFFSQGTDHEHDAKVLDVIRRVFGVEMVYQASERYWRSDTSELAEFMAFHGVTKCREKHVPGWLFSAALQLRQAFIAGFVAADGHIAGKRGYLVGGVNGAMIRQIRTIARSCGYKVRNISRRTNTIQAPNSPAPIECTYHRFGWSNWRGKIIAQEFGARNILSITPAGRDLVYDLSVDGAGTFIADGLVVHNTRWTADDLPGYLLDLQENDPQADRWRVIEIPAFVDAKAATQLNAHTSVAAMYDEIRRRAPGKPTAMIPSAPLHYRVGDSYAPRRYSTEKLDRTRGNVTERTWSALYLQRPVAESGHILKRDAWREWKQKEPPECYEIIACYDTAIEEDEEADYSARTTWGLFEFQGMTNAILIEAWRDRLPPHEILDEMKRHTKEFKVDRLLIEKRASGSWLVKEGRRRNLPTRAWLPPGGPRSKGKVPRAHAASVVLEGGAVWYVNRRWAQTVIDECADLPFGAHDDLADTTTMALLFLRERWRVELKVDHQDDEPEDEEFEPLERQLAGIYG